MKPFLNCIQVNFRTGARWIWEFYEKIAEFSFTLSFSSLQTTRRRGSNLINTIGITFDLVAPLVLILIRKKTFGYTWWSRREKGVNGEGWGRVFRREKGVNGEGWWEGIQEGNWEGRNLRIPYNIPTFF